jgi:hypothetical protein
MVKCREGPEEGRVTRENELQTLPANCSSGFMSSPNGELGLALANRECYRELFSFEELSREERSTAGTEDIRGTA